MKPWRIDSARTENPGTFNQLFPLFAPNIPSITEEIPQNTNIVTCPAKTRLYFAGDTCSYIEFIVSGDLRVFKASESGCKITLYEIGLVKPSTTVTAKPVHTGFCFDPQKPGRRKTDGKLNVKN